MEQGDLTKALQFADESLLRGWHDMKTRSLKTSILAHLDGRSDEYRRFAEESLAIDPLYSSLLCRVNPEEFDRATGGRAEAYLNAAYELTGFGFPQDASDLLAKCPAETPMKY